MTRNGTKKNKIVATTKTQAVRTKEHTTTSKVETIKKCHTAMTTKYNKKTETTSTKNKKETTSKEQKTANGGEDDDDKEERPSNQR
jgi:hypothetical protein